MGSNMNTNRNKSNVKKAPTANKLQVYRKNQKSPQEEYGAELYHGSPQLNHFDGKRKSADNQPESERTAWH